MNGQLLVKAAVLLNSAYLLKRQFARPDTIDWTSSMTTLREATPIIVSLTAWRNSTKVACGYGHAWPQDWAF